MTLVEMMISLAVGLLVLSAALSVFMFSRSARTTHHAEGQVQQTGSSALAMIASPIRAAGHVNLSGNIDPASFDPDGRKIRSAITGDLFTQMFGPDSEYPNPINVPAIIGCDGGFKSAKDLNSTECGSSAGEPALSVAYEVPPKPGEAFATGESGYCLGTSDLIDIRSGATSTPSKPVRYQICRISFRKSCEGSLNGAGCVVFHGNSAAGAQSVANNVHQMTIRYALAPNGTTQTVNRMATATEVRNANLWDQVTGVEVCLQVSHPNEAPLATTVTTQGCELQQNGLPRMMEVSGAQTWRTLRATINIRSRVRGTPLNTL